MKADMEMSVDEFFDTVHEELARRGTMISDLTGTVLEDILIERMRNAILLDIVRIAFFGDRNSTDPNYDQVDGYWKFIQLLAEDTNPVIPRVAVPDADLSASEGIDILREVYNASPNELRGLMSNEKRFYVTKSIYDRYREDIEDGGGGDFGLLEMIDGNEVLRFRGIEVTPMFRWDDIVDPVGGDVKIGSGSNATHLCLLTSPQNLVIATDVLTMGEDVDMWYEKKDEKFYAKARWKFGANYMHHQFFSVAY